MTLSHLIRDCKAKAKGLSGDFTSLSDSERLSNKIRREAFRMIGSDKLSTALGAPPATWRAKECEQMKHIHRCFRNAFTKDENSDLVKEVDLAELTDKDTFGVLFSSNVSELKGNSVFSPEEMGAGHEKEGKGEGEDDINNEEEPRDEEWFLPKNSPLRSKGGDLKAPLNVPFKDHDSFLQSCEFDQWREIFQQQSQDHFLSEVAKSLVAHVCTSQARKELRVRHGSVPAGKLLRKKREHITPLALVLHEIKLWAAHKLRNASVFEEETFKDIRKRIRYIEALSQKEVWGNAAGMLQQGMRPIAHDKLFRLFLTTKEDLKRAEDYAYRGFCRRSSREKLKRMSNLMKEVILREIRLLSYAFTLRAKLSDPKTKRLQPLSLLNNLQNQGFVDYRNFVNVCMYELFQMPLVQAALTSDYETEQAKNSLEDLSLWTASNLFCSPTDEGEPEFHQDAVSLLPMVYVTTAPKLSQRLKENDPHAKQPLAPSKHLKAMKKAFGDTETVKEIMKAFMKTCAALQDLMPSLFAMYKLWGIAGDGGDFTVYDTLRAQVIRVMSNTISRVYAVQSSSKQLMSRIGELCKQNEELMVKKRLKTRKAEYKPAWITNHYYLRTELLPLEKRGFAETYKQLWEIAKDAWEYNLSAEQLDEKVASVKQMCDTITGGGEIDYSGSIRTRDVIRVGHEDDWLNSRGKNHSGAAKKVKKPMKDEDSDLSSDEEYSDDDSY